MNRADIAEYDQREREAGRLAPWAGLVPRELETHQREEQPDMTHHTKAPDPKPSKPDPKPEADQLGLFEGLQRDQQRVDDGAEIAAESGRWASLPF